MDCTRDPKICPHWNQRKEQGRGRTVDRDVPCCTDVLLNMLDFTASFFALQNSAYMVSYGILLGSIREKV